MLLTPVTRMTFLGVFDEITTRRVIPHCVSGRALAPVTCHQEKQRGNASRSSRTACTPAGASTPMSSPRPPDPDQWGEPPVRSSFRQPCFRGDVHVLLAFPLVKSKHTSTAFHFCSSLCEQVVCVSTSFISELLRTTQTCSHKHTPP